MSSSSITPVERRTFRPRLGNTLVLVTAILVLLVIIATAFISRTQGGRSVTAAQQRSFQREDHAQLVGEQVAAEVAQALFPKPIDPRFQAVADDYANDIEDVNAVEDWIREGGSTGVLAASVWSGTPRTQPGIDPFLFFTAERYQPDPGDYVVFDPGTGDFTLPIPAPDVPATPADGIPDGFFDFNYAPYEVRPFTNWPDEFGDDPNDPFQAAANPLGVPVGPGAPFGIYFTVDADGNDVALGAGNPLGNPGYGDFRLLRDSEPRRMGAYYDGATSPQDLNVFPNDDPWSEYFTHWTHLSWLPTAENGWRVCYNIANVSPLDLDSYVAGSPVGPENGNTLSSYASDDPSGALYRDITFPAALQTPYEQWFPNVLPQSVDPVFNGSTFQLNGDRGAGWFADKRELWFGTPRQHFNAAANEFDVLPNFINLNRMTFAEQFMRRIAIEQDNAQALELANELRDLRREVERTYADTDGDGFTDSFWYVPPTPIDRGVRQVVGISVVDNGGMVDANVATAFDRWSTSGTTPSDLALVSRMRVLDDSGVDDFDTEDTHVGLFVDPKNTVDALQNGENLPFFEQASGRWLAQRYRPERWFATDFSEAPSFLNLRGISELRTSATNGGFGPFFGEYVAVERGTSFKDDPATAEQERRLWNRAAQRDGEGFYVRTDGTGNNAEDVVVPFSVTPFSISDEMELRAYAGQNHPYTYSRFERAVDDSVNVGNANNYFEGTQQSILRSALDRPETTPIQTYPNLFAGYGLDRNGGIGNPSTGTLSNQQLARDLRHRVTLFSGARNELRPMWLWATPFFDGTFDYDEDGFTGQALDYQEYQRRKRKIDLRQSYALPTDVSGTSFNAADWNTDYFNLRYPAVEGSWAWSQNQGRWLNDLQRTIELTMAYKENVNDSDTWQSYFGSPVYGLAGTGNRFQTVPYGAYRRSLLASASMTANIEAYRDGPSQPYNVFEDGQNDNTVYVDPPLHPLRARRTETVYDSDQTANPTDPAYEPEGFVGLEKQPFIMQVYAGLVYPKSRHGVGPRPNEGPLSDDSIIDNQPEWPAGFDIPDQFQNEAYLDSEQDDTADEANQAGNRNYVDDSSKPAIVLAIQLGNPFNEPVSLADFCLRVGDYVGADNDGDEDEYLWFAEMACPHTILQPGHQDEDPDTPRSARNGYLVNDLVLGPTESDAPRTAVVFAVIPPSRSGIGGPGAGGDPDAWVGGSWDAADFDGVDYATFRDTWLDELDLEPGNLFGYETDMPLRYHQTLVFDISRMLHEDLPADQEARLEALFDDENDRFLELIRQVEEPTLARFIELNGASAAANVHVPGDWNEDEVADLARAEIVVDRLKHEREGASGNQPADPRDFDFLDTLSRMIPTPTLGTGYSNRFTPPQVEDEVDDFENFRVDPDAFIDADSDGSPDGIGKDPENRWAGIHIGSDDFYLTWARVSRMWGWDVDRNGILDIDETSPRYVFSLTSTPTSSLPDLVYSRIDDDGSYIEIDDGDPLEDMRRRRLPGVTEQFRAWEGNVTDELARRPGKIPEAAQPNPQVDFEVVYGFRGDSFDTSRFTTQTDDTNEEPFLMGAVERVSPVAKAGIDRAWWFHGKPVNFPTWSALDVQDGDAADAIERVAVYALDFPIGVYPSSGDWENFATGYSLDIRSAGLEQDYGFVPMDLGAPRRSDYEGGFRPELWGNSLQMLLKDNDFEQIGELANVFMWGPVLQLPDTPLPKAGFDDTFTFDDDNYAGTNPWDQWRQMPHPIGDEVNGFAVVRTFPEVMTEIAVHQDALNNANLSDGGRGLRDDQPDDYPVGGGTLVNRLNIDLGFNDPGADTRFERPWTQVLGGARFSSLPAYRPKLPAGVGLFDAVTVDGRGINARHPDLNNDGLYLASEALRAEVDRYDLARGFSGNPTKGLLNLNTASLEALRCLPQMSRLVYNDYFENDAFADFRGRHARSASWTPRGEVIYGHDGSGDVPYSNHKHVRFAESIERYRLGDALFRGVKDFRANVPEEERFIPQPSLADRGYAGIDYGDFVSNSIDYDVLDGFYGYFPGMRNDRGVVSIGELLTMQRTSAEEFELLNGGNDPQIPGWIYRSADVRSLGRTPYPQGTSTNFARTLFHLGHRGVAGEEFPFPNNGGGLIVSSQADARVSTDRNNLRRTVLGRRKDLPYSNPSLLPVDVPRTEFAPDNIAADSEELNLLFSGMANMITTRSDVFTIYMTIRTFTQDPTTGIWDASKESNIIDESRYVMVVDRSQVESPTDRARILAFSKVE